MIEVNFCRAPSHYWVGWCVYENGTYYASGNTLDKLLYHIKRCLWTEKKISVRGVVLSSKQSTPADAPVHVFSKTFKTKYWKDNGVQVDEPIVDDKPKPLPEPTGNLDYDYYDTVSTGDELIVYGILRKEVARYKLNPNKMALPTAAPTHPLDVTPFRQPIVRYDTTKEDSYTDAQKEAAKWKPRADIPTE